MRNELLSTANRRDGVALVIVLSFLVLITVLVLAFFSSVTAELVGAKTMVNTLSARSLADSVPELVKGIIQQATRQGADYAWASQPGMIRTYDSNGDPNNFYRLYSSNNMVFNGKGFTAGDDVDMKWADKPAVFTDLNAPILVPVADKPDQYQTLFPILDPRMKGDVEGLDFSSLPSSFGAKIDKSNDARLPMPVQWIYVLNDGTLTTPDPASGAGGKPASFDSAPEPKRPSSTNPIVGRVAFWTDDESCKININTASEGTYWDVPRLWDEEEIELARNQPAQREYQRYPGHPATVSLSSVLGNTLGDPVKDGLTSKNASKLDLYYEVAPRVVPGGSKGGTVRPSGELTPDADRLYSSVDELVFKTPGVSDTTRPTNPSPRPGLTPDIVERARFFLTANSRAPEVNLFNLPRVSMWPEWKDASKRTAFDNLIAFCSTIGKQPYYFIRSDARSTTADWKGNRGDMKRNQELYNYLKTLTDRKIPGFGGGTFAAKFQNDRDQILTSIFDYIRCTNLMDTSNGATPYTPTFSSSNPSQSEGAGEVFPIEIGSTSGFGRFLTISEAAIMFYATAGTPTSGTEKIRAVLILELTTPMQGLAADWPKVKHRISGLENFKVTVKPPQAASFEKSLNFPADATNTIETAGVYTFHGKSTGGTEGYLIDFMTKKSFPIPPAAPKKLNGRNGKGNYPFCSNKDVEFGGPITAPLDFSGGTIKIEILNADNDDVVQTLNLDFPPATIRMPTVDANQSEYPADFEARLKRVDGDWGFDRLFAPGDTIISLEPAGADGNDPLPKKDGTAGDIRMIAGLKNVPEERFRAHQDYTRTVGLQPPYTGKAHSLLSAQAKPVVPKAGATTPTHGHTQARLANSPPSLWGDRRWNVPIRVDPSVPTTKGITRKDLEPGDWDSGVGLGIDGPFLNKPDEGESFVGTGDRIPYLEGDWDFAPPGQTFFSPNRQIPSPMMLGSIPTGVQRLRPWETLLFCSKPEDSGHPGHGKPPTGPPYTTLPDHLIADLFWMPVVEPYAISEPFSTMGKINMNYQIVPFTYIRRDIGMRAVLKATRFIGIDVADTPTYKPHIWANMSPQPPKSTHSKRYEIDAQKTLDIGFEGKWGESNRRPDIFRSATQISEIDLYPARVANLNWKNFWTTHALTGDNLREKPYVDLYGRLTTRSNVFTVHVKAQSLKKALSRATPDSDPRWTQWDESIDQVLGEYRGSSIIERYIDPNNPNLPDFATNRGADVNRYYRFRTVSTKQFGQ